MSMLLERHVLTAYSHRATLILSSRASHVRDPARIAKRVEGSLFIFYE